MDRCPKDVATAKKFVYNKIFSHSQEKFEKPVGGGIHSLAIRGLKQNLAPPLQPKIDTFSFTANQLIKFVATVAIKVAQPQACYTNTPEDSSDKSQVCVKGFLKQPKATSFQHLWEYLV